MAVAYFESVPFGSDSAGRQTIPFGMDNIFDYRCTFDPAEVAVMAKAYELGCIAIKGRPELDKERLAARIVDLAKMGERDAAQMSAKAINAVTSPN